MPPSEIPLNANNPPPAPDYRAKARASYQAQQKAPVVETKPELKAPDVQTAPEVKPEAKTAPEVKPEAKPPSDTIAKSFEKLAVDRESLRKERADFEAAAKDVEAVRAAMKAKDPRALLALAGMTHEDYVRAWTGKEVPSDEVPAPAPAKAEVPPEFTTLKTELDQLKAGLQKERVEKARRDVTAAFVPELKKLEAKYPLAARFGETSVQDALDVMENHFRKTGQNLAEDPVESFEMALGAVEERHQAIVSKYGFLTTKPEPAKVQDEAPGSPRVESVALTGGDEASKKLQAQPLKPGDYRARALESYRKHSTPR